MNGCPGYPLFVLIERFFGKEAVGPFIQVSCSKIMGLPSLSAVVEGNFRRIHSFAQGREPTPGEVEVFRRQMAQMLARDMLSKYEALRDPAGFDVPADVSLLPVLRGLLRAGRGAVLVSPHFGDTTMLYFGLARTGLPLHVMVNYAPPGAVAALAAAKLKFSLTDLSTGARYYLDALGRNEVLLLSADIDYFPGGRTLDFFGAPFNPPHGPVRLALAAGSPILPVYAVWDGTRHSLLCDAPIPGAGAEQEDVEKGILRSMERFIGRHPAHWLVHYDPWDLEACARANRRQLRQLRLRRSVEDFWRQLTNKLTRARIWSW